MAVLIRTSDGEGIIVKGTLAEVRQKLLAQGEALVEFDADRREARVAVNPQHVTSLIADAAQEAVEDLS
jgi:hypothetical protein